MKLFDIKHKGYLLERKKSMTTKELDDYILRTNGKRHVPYRFALNDFQKWLAADKVQYDGSLIQTDAMKGRISAFYRFLCEEDAYGSEPFRKGAILALCVKFDISASDFTGEGQIFDGEDEHTLVELWPSVAKKFLRATKKPTSLTSPVPLKPTVCNLCGEHVILTSNKIVYGKTYGNGKCYYCTNCHASVGTHAMWPDVALGLLSNEAMKKGRKYCHDLFDPLWMGKKHKGKRRTAMYKWLTSQMDLPENMSGFGFFTLEQLREAYKILKKLEGKKAIFSENFSEVIAFQ